MAGFGNNFGNGNSNNYGFPNIPPQPRIYPQVNPYDPIYVTGIDGANAFQMPPGVNRIILWDTEVDRFYIKMLDEIGRPRVVAVKDFFDHVEPEKKVPPAGVDMSAYPMNDGYGYRMGGRPYYDDEKDHAVHKLRGIMDTTNNDEVRMAVQSVLNELSR